MYSPRAQSSVHPSVCPVHRSMYSVQNTVQPSTHQCTPSVQPSVQCHVHSTVWSVHSPVYSAQCSVCPVYVQCTAKYILQFVSSTQSSVCPAYSAVYIQCTSSVSVTLLHVHKILWMAFRVILTRNGKNQIVNRFKEGRIKGTKFKWTENWIAWHWIQVSDVPEFSWSRPHEQH